MQQVKLWGEIYKIHEETNRIQLLKNNGHTKLLYICVAIYAIFSISVFFFNVFFFKNANFFILAMAIFLVAMTINIIFTFTLSKDYSDELKGQPLFSTPKYIKFIEFKKRFESNPNLSPEKIPLLLEWEEVRNMQFDSINFLTHPLTLVVISAFLSILLTSFSSEGSDIKLLIVVYYIFMATMFSFWAAYDFITSSKRRNFENTRLLRWLQIEYQNQMV